MSADEPPSPFAPGDLEPADLEILDFDLPGATSGNDAPGPGFFLRGHGAESFRFVPWTSERSLTEALAKLPPVAPTSDATAEVRMAPGRYVIESEILINGVHHLTFTGHPEAEFVFADGPDATTHLIGPVAEGDLVLRVEHPSRMRAGFHYQIYAADGRGDRMLEFTVLAVKDGLVYLKRAVNFMQHVTAIRAGAQVMQQVNFLRVRKCHDLTLQGLRLDGRHRGGTRTHTTYCGAYVTGNYVPHRRATTKGLVVRGCTFRNLKGRGIAFYGMEDVTIERNYFEHIRAQAIEIDHFASGYIHGNVVNGAEIGVMVNDAYESVVEGNILRHCQDGVRFMEIYDDPWVNTGNLVRGNDIGPGYRFGVFFRNEGMVDNVVEGNVFRGFKANDRVVGGEGNEIRLDG
ncbi:MAG: right-handed parallel beta-helix repeat-containing protein [Planctomycetota bacterium]